MRSDLKLQWISTAMFQGPGEEVRALEWMKDHILDSFFKAKGPIKTEMDNLMNELTARIDSIKNEYISSCDLHADLWDRFIFCMTGKSRF